MRDLTNNNVLPYFLKFCRERLMMIGFDGNTWRLRNNKLLC